MEKRKFLSDLIFVQVLNLFVKAIWILVIDRAVQDLLPAEQYGGYYRMLSLSILFVILLDLGLNNRNSAKSAANPDYFSKHFGSYLKIKLAFSVTYILMLGVAAFVLNIADTRVQIILGTLGGFQIINSYNQYFRSNLAALHKFKLDGLLASLDRVLVILVLGSFLLFESANHLLTIQNFVFVQLIGVCVSFVALFFINLRLLNRDASYTHQESFKDIVKSALPYALLITLMAIFTRVDAIMIGQLTDDIQTDRYAMSYRLLDAANMMAALFSGMLLPMFSRQLANKSDTSNTIGIATRVMVVPAILLAVVLQPHTEFVLNIMYPSKIALAAPQTFSLLLFAFVGSASVYIFGTLLTSAQQFKKLNILAALMAGLNMILNFVLIPKYGIDGAAAATLVTQGGFAIGCLYGSKNYWKSDVSTVAAIKWIGGILALVLVYHLSKQFFKSNIVHLLFGFVLSAVYVVSTGLITPKQLKTLSRRKTHNASDN